LITALTLTASKLCTYKIKFILTSDTFPRISKHPIQLYINYLLSICRNFFNINKLYYSENADISAKHTTSKARHMQSAINIQHKTKMFRK